MKENITLKMLSSIQTWLGHGVRIAFCTSEKDDFEVMKTIDCVSFKNIEKVIMDTWKYKVFRIDTLNDLICVYVVDMEETL